MNTIDLNLFQLITQFVLIYYTLLSVLGNLDQDNSLKMWHNSKIIRLTPSKELLQKWRNIILFRQLTF